MAGVGTLCNVVGIVAGGAAGLVFSRFFNEGLRKLMLTVCGLSLFLMGLTGAMQEMLTFENGTVSVRGSMTVPYGKGCLFAAIPVGICQGTVTATSGLIQPVMTAQALSNLSMVGSVIILATGINLIWDKDIKVANLTPALFVAVALAFL